MPDAPDDEVHRVKARVAGLEVSLRQTRRDGVISQLELAARLLAVMVLVLLCASWLTGHSDDVTAVRSVIGTRRSGFGLFDGPWSYRENSHQVVARIVLALYVAAGLSALAVPPRVRFYAVVPAAGAVATLVLLAVKPGDQELGSVSRLEFAWQPAAFVAVLLWIAVAVVGGLAGAAAQPRR